MRRDKPGGSLFFCTLFAILTLFSPSTPAAVPVITPGSWTLALLPDTQHYAASYPAIFNAQTNFLVNNKTALNLQFVLHEGDITNNNTAAQWANASAAMQILDAGGVNYAMAPGNHDYITATTFNPRSSLMENYFPVSRLDDQPTFGGVYPGVNNSEITSPLNSYSTFSAGGKDYLVLALEFGPRDEVLDWADSLLKANPTREAMIVTHAYMYSDSTRYDWATKGTTQTWNPHAYISGTSGETNDGEEMWQALKDNANLKFVFNGHVLNDGTGYLASTGDNGNIVNQMLANYQFLSNGGNGYMRLLEFLPDGNTVHVRTYSPYLDSLGQNPYLTTADQDFLVTLSPPPNQYHVVGANLVAGGPAIPASNTFTDLTVPQTGTPAVGTLQVNRGDYQISVAGNGITYSQGVLLATITQNARDGIRGTVEVGRNSFSDGLLALSVTQAGNASFQEANFNASVAWFRFDGGWQAAHVNAAGTIAAGNRVAASMLAKLGVGRYSLDLGVDSRADGMLFTIANNNGNYIVPTGVHDDGNGWDIRVQTNTADFSATGADKDFSFVYLPYTTKNLIGGHYDGLNDANFTSVGNFTMTRLATGQYRLTIPGQSSPNGMLILTVSRETAKNGVTAPDDNFLTYEYEGSGSYLINSYDLTGSATSGTAGLGMDFQDTNFVWAFVNFNQPLILPDFVWNNPLGGNWHSAVNWSINTVPNGPGAVANFHNSLSQGAAVNLDAAVTMGKLVFDSTSGHLLQGNLPLYLLPGELAANRLEVLRGNHEIAVPIFMDAATQVDIAAEQSLTLSKVVGGSFPLTKEGEGLLILSNNNTYTGVTTIEEGTLMLSANGQIASSAAVVNNATFQIAEGTHLVNSISGSGTTMVSGPAVLMAPRIIQDTLIIGGTANPVPEPGSLTLLILTGLAFGSRMLIAKSRANQRFLGRGC